MCGRVYVYNDGIPWPMCGIPRMSHAHLCSVSSCGLVCQSMHVSLHSSLVNSSRPHLCPPCCFCSQCQRLPFVDLATPVTTFPYVKARNIDQEVSPVPISAGLVVTIYELVLSQDVNIRVPQCEDVCRLRPHARCTTKTRHKDTCVNGNVAQIFPLAVVSWLPPIPSRNAFVTCVRIAACLVCMHFLVVLTGPWTKLRARCLSRRSVSPIFGAAACILLTNL